MPLLALSNELIPKIARSLLHCPVCRLNHLEQYLSALSRSNHRLHALLADCDLETASAVDMLLWAIAHSRHDTIARALERGADPNTPRQRIYITSTRPVGTPVDVAIRMRVYSFDAESHARKLGTLALLLRAGGICTSDSLIKPTLYGDLDPLTLCLPHHTDIDTDRPGPRTILEIAARRGHTEVVRLAIRAGAAVNSTGTHKSAGSDPTWHSWDGVSVVQHIRQRSGYALDVEDKIALLVRYGAVDELPLEYTLEWQRRMPTGREYRGWTPGSREDTGSEVRWDWAKWVPARLEVGCL